MKSIPMKDYRFSALFSLCLLFLLLPACNQTKKAGDQNMVYKPSRTAPNPSPEAPASASDDISIRGARTNGTVTYIDGAKTVPSNKAEAIRDARQRADSDRVAQSAEIERLKEQMVELRQKAEIKKEGKRNTRDENSGGLFLSEEKEDFLLSEDDKRRKSEDQIDRMKDEIIRLDREAKLLESKSLTEDEKRFLIRLREEIGRLEEENKHREEDLKKLKHNTEDYARIYENPILSPKTNPLSTFSIDVDVASYANTRRFLNDNRLPPPDAVRIEELINYFDYDYTQPRGEHPFSIHSEVSICPWEAEHYLVHVGLQGRDIHRDNLAPSNLVFLLDVSGSMNSRDKLPLLKSSFGMLVDQLDPDDRIAIVVYAGAAGLVLPSTPVSEKQRILKSLNKLGAGGSTAGGAGIELAYKVAQDNFIRGGNNRVILATDGDFNVGPSSQGELVRMIEEKRENDVFLSVLGFGSGNLKDSRMEQLADKGNGNYAYIDNLLEAKKVLVNEMAGTLFAIAKDVKLQIEFNPAYVKGYRLIGYENRVMAAEDFEDDTKDAGELGAGHAVTALYEVVPYDASTEVKTAGDLKYQINVPHDGSVQELMYVKFRYKKPTGDVSTEMVHTIGNQILPLARTSNNYRFSAAVAEFGLLLRGSAFQGSATYDQVIRLAKAAKGADDNGYRAEFIQLVERARMLDPKHLSTKNEY